MKLLLDLGNTRLKWALQQGDGWLAQGSVAWDEPVEGVLSAAWSMTPQPVAVYGASVVDAAREQQLAACVASAFRAEVTWLRTPAIACGVRNAYAEPQRLGVDRFLAMVAAYVDGHAPCVLASVGTALYPEDGASKDSLLSAADAAMYVTKHTRQQVADQVDANGKPDVAHDRRR